MRLVTRALSHHAVGHVSGRRLTQKYPTLQLSPTNLAANREPCNSRRVELFSTAATNYPGINAVSDSTIYALSTAPGRGAIAVIRVSGPACREIYGKLCPQAPLPRPRVAAVRTLYNPSTTTSPDDVLDTSALVLFFDHPRTVTGEDVLEVHVHGGPAVVKAVLAAIPKCASPDSTAVIRYAEAGEFTKRAFFNNRLDLTQVEALGDILAANTEQQRKLSVRGAGGELSKLYETWRERLLYARGELEALIDFSEDQHFDESPQELCESVAEQVRDLLGILQVHRQNAARGELLRHGISISLLGAPNAGKSSLLNTIIGREAAIVSSEAGTTRDVVEVGIDLGGFYCRLGDTAGLRNETSSNVSDSIVVESIGHIESEGMRRAKARAAESDVVIVVLSIEHIQGRHQVWLDEEVVGTARQLIRDKNNVVVVLNKADRTIDPRHVEIARQHAMAAFTGLSPDNFVTISCRDALQQKDPSRQDPGQIQALLQVLIRRFSDMTRALSIDSSVDDMSLWQESLGASERHRILLSDTMTHLEAFLDGIGLTADVITDDASAALAAAGDLDLVVGAEHLRRAADCMAKITGRGAAGDVEEVLGVVFEKFCVGK